LVAFAAGVVVLQTCAVLPPVPAPVAAGAAGAWIAVAAAVARGELARWLGMALSVGAAFAMGFAYAGWRAELRLGDALAPQWEDVDIRIVGVIDALPAVTANGTRFAFAVERVLGSAARVPARISLRWFAPMADREPAVAVPGLRAGERWELTVRLRRPHGNVNPGGFDLEAWLLQQGLRATGHVRPDGAARRVAAPAGRARDLVQRAREAIRARIARALSGAPYAGVVTALAIGDQQGITEAQWKVFNRTGVGHLVSISGLHVTVFASIVGGFALLLARRSTRLTSRVPARKVAAVAGLVAASGYVALAGAEIPALRTLAMLGVAACGLCVGRPGTAALVWLWALVAVLLFDPFASLTPGFWLSYGAVGLLLYAAAAHTRVAPLPQWGARIAKVLAESAHAQWVVTLGLAPLTLALFGQMSLIGPVANAVAIPLVTLAVVPLALVGIVVPFDALFVASHAVLAPLKHMLEQLAALPAAAWEQHAPPAWTVGAALAGVLWHLAPQGVPGRGWGLLWLLPMFVVRPEPPPPGGFRLTVLDVGQGLAVVVQTRAHVLVYDTGPRFTDTADAGGRIVAPFLRHAGLRRADALIVSHQDLDHAGGALSLLHTVPIGWLASSLPDDHPIAAAVAPRAPVWLCVAGQQWTWDGVHFTMLHPTATEYGDRFGRTNDRSCVVRIDSPHGSALLPGEIEARSESVLLRAQRDTLRADVIVIPHHGSRTSSTPAFVRAVAPSVALAANGHRNRFGHPRSDVVARFETLGARVLRTDRDGALTVRFEAPGGPGVSMARTERARYWIARPAP
jgi:competence protein ComEC